VAFVAQSVEKWFVVIDGKEGKHYDDIGKSTLVFSPDSRRVAYGVQSGKERFAVIDGQEGKHYDSIGFSLTFSPDNMHLVYAAQSGKKQFIVVDKKEEKHYDEVLLIGKENVIFDSSDSLHYLATKDKNIYLVEFKIKDN
jgi:hypothetical protein